jgi:hypothetical protein
MQDRDTSKAPLNFSLLAKLGTPAYIEKPKKKILPQNAKLILAYTRYIRTQKYNLGLNVVAFRSKQILAYTR